MPGKTSIGAIGAQMSKLPDGALKIDPSVLTVQKTAQLKARIEAIMQENTPDSYRYVICDDTRVLQSGAGGASRLAIDPPETKATVDDRMIICSMSKTITAIAVLSTLQSKNLSVDIPVAAFLPPGWQLHEEVRKLTFRDFLTHRTGFHWDGKTAFQDGTDYDTMKKVFAQKPWNPSKAAHDYRNINFAIFRLVLPLLDSYDRFAKKVTFILPTQGDVNAILSKRYVEIVNQRVLSPSGVAAAGCNSKTLMPPAAAGGRPAPIGSATSVLAYHYQNPTQKGFDEGDQTLSCGASGWALSVGDIAKVLQTALFTEVVLSEKSRSLLLLPGPGESHGLGMNRDSDLLGGAVYSHGAWIPYEKGAPPDGAQLAGWYMYLEAAKLIIVALSNSGHKPGAANWYDRVKAAYAETYTS